MAHHSDTTISEPPLSPFSTRSLLSDGTQTSDGSSVAFSVMNPVSNPPVEPADLGAFNSVFRALNQLQIQQQHSIDPPPQQRPDSRATVSYSESESDLGDSSTVWSQQPIASYLTRDDSNESSHSHSTPEAVSEDEGLASDSSGTEGQLEDDTEIDGVSPSLGYLDSALGFLAAEKAKLAVVHVDGRNTSNSSTGESWRHGLEPKRKRRRKRKGPSALARTVEQDHDLVTGTRAPTVVPTPEGSSSSPEFPSPLDKNGRNGNGSIQEDPLAAAKRRRSSSRHLASNTQTRTHSQQRLYIPSSAPIPIPHSLPTPPDARIVRLRALAARLQQDFPQDGACLARVLVDDIPVNDVVDPRGPEPLPGEPLTHVFIDHSNILIGFLNLAKRSRRTPPGKVLMSFAALALILERGRPITRRVLATSSPLYQNMDIAEDLGYSVHVYVRVPDFSGDGTNASNTMNNNNNNALGGPTLSSRNLNNLKTRKIPILQTSSMSARTSTESDPGQLPSPSNLRSSARPNTHSRSLSATTASISPSPTTVLAQVNGNGNAMTAAGRIRYREQGVDELLQLKLHQALVSPDADPPPPGATIVLATGDGASGQFNEDGFVGVVRTALKKGWMVELYAWGGGLSGAWRKVAEDVPRGRLQIWEMDPYVSDLIEAGAGS